MRMVYETVGVLMVVVVAIAYVWRRKGRVKAYNRYIDSYQFPNAIVKKVHERYPTLQKSELTLVMQALRDFFIFCSQANREMVAMPSQVVDVAWHEFILYTREYKRFSIKALGRFLHHTPTEAMKSPTQATKGIKRAWRLACAKEGIDPKNPSKLPLLFAIDALLNIDDGFIYTLDCRAHPGSGYCGSEIGCAAGCAGESGTDSVGFSCAGDSGGASCGGGCGGS